MDSDTPVSRRRFLQGAAGATAAAASAGVATAQEGEGGGGGGSATVAVGPNGDYVYTPGTEDPLYVSPGTTVTFEWESDNHNINPTSVPEGAEWEGHMPTENTGFSYEHTFETLGTYEYQCDPHAGLGMKGTIIVNETGAPPSTGGGGPSLPDSAMSLAVGTVAAMLTTLSLAYVFLRYGGDYETPQ
ncbi:plastocyanin/azurin family copper-binding protein [Haloarchaeobius sp. FL176]|uniref:plastocyanin/azurin family copper-binding protein n=1 Tax=Haloarchaeobius sp. FL176 TaxID=2967129 RepID=UPI0021478734|nr:plastocyanin/azurin family copper-binding protein [Haloarchaeobius sp. FL176]